ncbi:DUF2630 family protein [Pseudonocardia acaciae]|uniref:DUF2630 family protein n=1 Tax=Pseudonocardia acaciae TaxID=551276 RepID=UPI00048ED3DD|nr:DUF2630 family protein [Pseudonocardia acaciae]
MNDREITARISELVDEEHRLEREHVGQALSEDEQARMRMLNGELDRCWDLLRQRRARREMGQDPDGAEVRSERTVENYQQ